jgi:hypothetical protein
MSKVYVIPKAGLKLRDPEDLQHFLPSEGQEVSKTSFWIRRRDQGDVAMYCSKPEPISEEPLVEQPKNA